MLNFNFEVSMEIDVYCTCGAALTATTSAEADGSLVSVLAEPCQKCMEQADKRGYSRAQDES
jgi:hypothetical protein